MLPRGARRRLLASGSWSSVVKLWSLPDCNFQKSLRGHKERVSSVAFHPRAGVGQSKAGVNLASGGADHKTILWSLDK